MQVIVDGLMTNYEDKGVGPGVLMLHGWADSLKGFSGISSIISKNHRVIAVDLPGFGGTDSPSNTWGLEDYAKWVGEFAKKIKFTPSVVVGHSNGGAIAILAIDAEYVKPRKLVLIASSGIRVSSVKNVAFRIFSRITKPILQVMPSKLSLRIKKTFYSSIGSDYLVSPHMKKIFSRVVTRDISEEASRVKLPTVLIYGDKDGATPIYPVAKSLNTLIEGSKLNIVPGSDHFVHQHFPDKVVGFMEFDK